MPGRCRGKEGMTPGILTSAQYGGRCSISRLGRLYPRGKEPPVPIKLGGSVDPKTYLDILVKRESLGLASSLTTTGRYSSK
jgi:hypothetical protein